MKPRAFFIAAVILPIVALAALVAEHEFRLRQGKEFILKIEGYDPRDLLSGHYLTYQVNYEAEGQVNCSSLSAPDSPLGTVPSDPEMCVCFTKEGTREFLSCDTEASVGCEAVLRGTCQGRRFTAGIERFYIPENKSLILDYLVGAKRGEIVVSVPLNGRAVIKDLLIDGKSWRFSPDL